MKESDDDKRTRLDRDLTLAEYICREIRKDHPEALSELYETYQVFFEKITLKRTRDADLTHEILQDFWAELLDGDDICGYQAQNGISLKGYLLRRLYFRTIDAMRRAIRHERRFVTDDSGDPEQPELFVRVSDAIQSKQVETHHPNHDRIDVLFAALDALSAIRPADVDLIRQMMIGRTYDEIAGMMGANTEDEIKRKSAALRQQFVRSKTRLRIIIDRLADTAP
jgi:DNA-directed RNA polymerase specialized sigma24 family protein